MTSFHKSVSTAKKSQEEKENSAVAKLEQFLFERRAARQPVDDLEEFERELHSLFATAEAEVVGHEVNRFDVDRPFVTVNGVVHHQVLRCEDTYFCASGPVQVMRSLYSTRKDSERAICPMELQAGLVEGRWTPHAAKQATWVVSHLTPGEGEELFQMFGGLKPSKSSLDRLPKQLGQRWERERIEFEDVLRAQERVPAEAVSMAVSLDGVMVPMKNGQRQTKRAKAAKEGKYTRGPAGNKEVGCGTLSFYDEEGERLATIRMARMPEVKKATLKVTLSKEVNSCLAERPDLKVVKVADGAKDNWTFLSGELPDGEEVIDFYHAAGHLDTALAVAYGDTHPKRSAQFKKLRHVLVEDDKGVEKVDPFSRAPPRHVSAPKKDCPRTEVFSAQSASNALRRAQETRSADRFRSHGGSVQDSSNPTLEEVRNALGRARRPSHSILPRSRAEQSLRASLDPARTYLQGGGYGSRQCRADTQLAMIGVSMRVTPKRFGCGSFGTARIAHFLSDLTVQRSLVVRLVRG